MCVPLRNFEVLIVIIKKLDNRRKETTNHLVIYAFPGRTENPRGADHFRLQVLGLGISVLEVYEQYMKLRGKYVNFVCKKAQNG